MNQTATAEVEPLPAKKGLIRVMADRYGVDADKLLTTLKATCFKGPNITNEQMMALMVVANEYKLNPFTREIFAFPDKGGIVPVVSVDGWSRIINEHPQFDGLEFQYSDEFIHHEPADQKQPPHQRCPEWCEVVFYRKDRAHPIAVREYLDEVYRPAFFKKQDGGGYWIPGPWQSHTKRMLRHKALIQGARVAFGFAGIYDEDEAHRIIEAEVIPERPAIVQPQRLSEAPTAPEMGDANVASVRAALEAAGITETELLTAFDRESLEELVSERLEDVDEWICDRST